MCHVLYAALLLLSEGENLTLTVTCTLNNTLACVSLCVCVRETKTERVKVSDRSGLSVLTFRHSPKMALFKAFHCACGTCEQSLLSTDGFLFISFLHYRGMVCTSFVRK